MTDSMNDAPINTLEDDKYGVTPFAASLAKSILNISSPVGTTIALHGPWGSGKSSAVNLVRRHIEAANDEKLIVSEFKGWWYRGEEALALAFLQNLNSILVDTLGEKVKDLVPKLGKGLLQAGPILGSALSMTPLGFLGTMAGKSVDFAARFFPEGDPVEKTFNKLRRVLAEENRRILIIIDDIDRLEPDEALAVFRLVKSVGNLPNVIYLLVFDRALADKTVSQRYPSEGPHFLEKIIQAAFELPVPLQADLNMAVLASIDEFCGPIGEDQTLRTMNLFYDVVAPHITTPRHVARFVSAISVTWPAIKGEVSVGDFIALEVLRLYEPILFNAIKTRKAELCEIRQQCDPAQNDESRLNSFMTGIDEKRHDLSKQAVQRLFPRLESMGYGGDFISGWDAERRVCIEKHFDTYFRLSLSDETLPSDTINDICNRADDADFVQNLFREAAGRRRKNGKTMIPVYFDTLNSHASGIDKKKVPSFLTSLFEIHDEIDLEIDADRGFYGMANTSLRYHWLIRRLTDQRFDLEERTQLYKLALGSSSLGWLVDFVSSARGHYIDREDGPRREEDCLVAESSISELTTMALSRIRAAAKEGSLLHHNNLFYILYRWRDFNDNNPGEVRAWADEQLNGDEALVIFARQLTGESWSYGMGMFGLGDRVASRQVRAQLSDETDILNVDAFQRGLERILKEKTLPTDQLRDVQVFLEAWERRRNGEDD